MEGSGVTYGSGVIVATVPGLEERHVVARLRLNGPVILFIFGCAKNQAKGGAELVDRERGHADSLVLHRLYLGQKLLVKRLARSFIHCIARAEAVDLGFDKRPFLVEQVERNEFFSRFPSDCRLKRCRQEELTTVCRLANECRCVVVVVDSDELGWLGWHVLYAQGLNSAAAGGSPLE